MRKEIPGNAKRDAWRFGVFPRMVFSPEYARIKGVFTWENSHRREFHSGMIFWCRIAFTFHISLFKGIFHVDKMHAWFKIALPVPEYRQTDFTPKRVVVSRLHFISRYLKVYFMLIKCTRGSKSRYPFQSTDRPISHRNGWSFRVYMIPLRDFVPEWNSRPGTTTGVNSRRGDSRRHDILWWYHVNKYRAMRGNRSELAPGRTSPWCHVNTP